MQTSQIGIAAFGPEHLSGAVNLSQQVGWPHRPEDWEMALDLSDGVVAVAGGQVVGTVLVTPYREECATINMVIVAEAMRGRGLGRMLMDAAMNLAGERSLRLVATAEGLPLYERLGFRQTGRVLQHQGIAAKIAAPPAATAGTMADVAAIAELDRAAFGADRSDLISYLGKTGEFAVVRQNGKIIGSAVLRTFGRGEVIGPVVAASLDDAKALVAHFIARRPGKFLRVDTIAAAGLSDWLTKQGLPHVDGAIAMMRPPIASANSVPTIFALANQALG